MNARYAPPVIRLERAWRYVASVSLMLAVGCTAASPAADTTTLHPHGDPLPVSENQQGHRVDALADDADPAASEEDGTLVDQPSIAGVFLWCQTPTGRACRLASAALGTGPKDPSGLPPGLLTVEDLSDDCTEPTIATIDARLSTALAVQPTGWRDQGGSYLDMSLLGDMYSAAGCINDADPSRPIAKVSAADHSSPRVYLVRVWDGAAPSY